MNKLNENVQKTLQSYGIFTRPKASPGLWLFPLLPLSIIISTAKHPTETSRIYKYSSTISLGLLLTSLVFILQCARKKEIHKSRTLFLLPGSITATLFYVNFETGFLFSFCSGFVSGVGYSKLLLFVLRKFRNSFTVGEAIIVTQATILFVYSSVLNILSSFGREYFKTLDTATIILQVSLLSIGTICILTYSMKAFRKAVPFYLMSSTVFIFLLIIPLHLILGFSPVVWILNLVFKDMSTLKLVLYWASCSVLAALTVKNQIVGAKKATTAVRKTFHLLAVAVYLPGLIYECSLMYLASGIVFGIFVVLELLRILNVPPLGLILQEGFMVYSDEKDAGVVAFTPIYLLVGCSIPIWVHPAPCDITDSAGFYLLPLLSGLLCIGVGDAAASTIGSKFGRHFWSDSKKTVEGTLACIFSQVLMIYGLYHFGLVMRGYQWFIKSGIAILISSLIEAKTSQVDNLVLPLVMYIVLV